MTDEIIENNEVLIKDVSENNYDDYDEDNGVSELIEKYKTIQINDKYLEFLKKVAKFVGIFRENPHLFVKHYLNINLKDFQKVLLWEFVHNNYSLYIASRGQGKTFLDSICACTYAILFPHTKIVVAASTRKQGNEMLLKITEDLMKNYGWGSENLCKEITYSTVSENKAEIRFANGSWIKVVTPSDTARGARANILFIDEFWMLDLNTINTVLRRFLTAPRHPAYLDLPEYAHLQERNKEIYTGSAYYKSHWSFTKARTYFKNMLRDDKKYFVCDLPYQIAIKNNLLSKEQIQDEMGEDDFDEIKFSIEMEGLFFGDSDGAFFDYDDLLNIRKIEIPYYFKNDLSRNIVIPEMPDLLFNERRILSVDIALMASTRHKNDASSIILNRAIPTNRNTYIGNFVYLTNIEGIIGSDLALKIRMLFDYFKATDLAIDAGGLGLPIVQELMKDLIDTHTGTVYPALACYETDALKKNKDLNEAFAQKNAQKVIWAIQAYDSFNTDLCTQLRTGIQNNKLNLLVSKDESEEILKDNIKNYNKLTPSDKLSLQLPYINTDLFIRELVGLQHKVIGTQIQIKEKSGARKDRYSSAAYNYWVQQQIEKELFRKLPHDYTMREYAKGLRQLNRKPTIY